MILNSLEIFYKIWHLYGTCTCAVSARLYHDSENETVKTNYFLLSEWTKSTYMTETFIIKTLFDTKE